MQMCLCVCVCVCERERERERERESKVLTCQPEKEQVQNQLHYLLDSTEMADIRGPYIPLFGAAVVPFPTQ